MKFPSVSSFDKFDSINSYSRCEREREKMRGRLNEVGCRFSMDFNGVKFYTRTRK